ncbi:syntabulin-like isoform X1 [Sinocyclocheilus anshuiensis]|uniref:syntabulin-like isoform X1 n=2 Tax=Sinocyclocheilus anshuiensis TaxID=1608454 RepID=UPI0007B7F1AC|nr:PREDICTED: syntabulin-like isoform X1 [Sinocyclocheilus anshuiensis]XP_016330750.1 PREDICTED: syntabulin-like isoform X1 [Sinocyclocheilus anshuiensis]
MGPFQTYEVKEKGSMRSRIPRFVLHPLHTKAKESSGPNMPLSEEESKDFDISSQHSKRTISPSLSSADTGCPSSQCVLPTKTLSGSDNSPLGSPTLGERKVKVTRVRMNVVAEWSAPTQKHKREKQQRSPIMHKGSETDFSSSSNTGSYKTHETQPSNSAGKNSSSRSRGPQIRSLPVFKPAGSPTAPRDAELFAPYRTPQKAPSITNSSSNSSSTRRRTTPVRYHSCGDNHGIKPPNPEQYLTPLQQKEVAIRHLKTKLRDSQNTVCDREAEIEELKSQLGRMREDWIEEECHRVEAQLALKEARKEIKQLRQVVETMKISLMEKDKGIQKYFIDINIQNRKLESLLHSMELAQNGCNLQDEPTLEFICDSLERSAAGKLEMELHGEEQAVEEMADSELLANDEMANRAGILEQVLMSTAVDSSQDGGTKIIPQPGLSILEPSVSEKSTEGHISTNPFGAEDKSVQTDEMIYTTDLQALLFQLLKLQGGGFPGLLISSPHQSQESPSAQVPKKVEDLPEAQKPINKGNFPEAQDDEVKDVGLICTNTAQNTVSDSGLGFSEPQMSPQFMEELNFDLKNPKNTSSMAVVGKSYWSNNFLVDLVAVAAPVLPTVVWLYSQHGLVGGAPVYNIAALIRGCCIMGLHSLRHVSHGPGT